MQCNQKPEMTNFMKDQAKTSYLLVAESYERYRQSVFFYIYKKVNNKEDAEDLTQDSFLRLLDYQLMLRPDTVKYFLFTIVRNLVNDYLRRYYKWQEISSYMYEVTPIGSNDCESRIIADNLEQVEKEKLATLPVQRRKVYCMSRFEEKSVGDIAEVLNLSPRTVENHLLVGRREIREFIKKCI